MNTFRRDEDDPASESSTARSFSGHERNRLFIQTSHNFADVSLVSGLDSQRDGRGFVLVDYDRDGWLDVGLYSPLGPRFQLFRNGIGSSFGSLNQSCFVRLQGGSAVADGQSEWSNRDGVGSRFLVTIGDQNRMYQTSIGEGLASQNSRWVHIGMGDAAVVDRIEVFWPSGKQTIYENVAAGTRAILLEDGTMNSN